MRKSSLTDTSVAISREVQSEYDNIKLVAENINAVKQVASADLGQLGADITGLEADTQVIENKIAAGGLTGPRGLKGDTGDQGARGTDGTNGTDGANGLSAYELAVSQGFVGSLSDWLDSLKGADGADATNNIRVLTQTAYNNLTTGEQNDPDVIYLIVEEE